MKFGRPVSAADCHPFSDISCGGASSIISLIHEENQRRLYATMWISPKCLQLKEKAIPFPRYSEYVIF